MRNRLALLGAPLALMALAACSSDSDQVADEIAKDVNDLLKIEDAETTCPDDAEAGEGNEFDCTVTIEGQELEAHVVFTSDDEFEAEPNGDVFDTAELEELIAGQTESQLGADVTLDCPGETNTVIPADETIECPGEAGDGTSGTVVVGLDANGSPEIVELIPD